MKRLLPLLLVLVLLLPAAVSGESLELVILHTNDLHGASLARLGALIEEQREVHPYSLWVDGGDLFSGTPVSQHFQGEAEQNVLLQLGIDGIALGNHDFDFGLAALERSLEAGLPWLSANVLKEDGTHLAAPFLLKEVGGIKVLLIGVTTPETPRMSYPHNVAGLTFTDPEQAVREILQAQAGNYHLCVVLSHLGYGEDLLLAQRVPGIKVIVGGHSHTVLASPVRMGDTLIVQTGSSAQYVGKVTISLEESYPARGELLRLDDSITPHPLIAALEGRYEGELAAELDQVLGFSKMGYTKSMLGILLTRALQEAGSSDAALYNGGGVRSGLEAGTITKRDVFAVEPFGNQAVVVRLTGRQMAELLEVRAQRSGDFYTGPRLVDLDKTYTVATSDFLTSPESSYPMLAEGEIVYLGVSVREILESYLAREVLEQNEEGAR